MATLAQYNCMPLNSILLIGRVIHTSPQACSGPTSGGSHAGTSASLSSCSKQGHSYSTANINQDIPCVAVIQTRLNDLDQAGLSVDGHFGPLTEAAVRVFQGKYGLAVSGVVNGPTWRMLANPSTPKKSPTHPVKGIPTNYRYPGGRLCGYIMYLPFIPRIWPLKTPVPNVYNPLNIVWLPLGAPWDGEMGTVIPGYTLIASYYGNGHWSGNWAVIHESLQTHSPVVAARAAWVSWKSAVCRFTATGPVKTPSL